jgi:predicted small metal-binding protein
MAKLIRCECGFVARGDSDDQVAGMIRGHMASDHPALLSAVSREDLLSWIQAEQASEGSLVRTQIAPIGLSRSMTIRVHSCPGSVVSLLTLRRGSL